MKLLRLVYFRPGVMTIGLGTGVDGHGGAGGAGTCGPPSTWT